MIRGNVGSRAHLTDSSSKGTELALICVITNQRELHFSSQ